MVINIGSVAIIETGIRLSLPRGTYFKLFTRSSYAILGMEVVGGVIDPGYKGTLKVCIRSDIEKREIRVGDKIAQGVVSPFDSTQAVLVAHLSERGCSARGSKGFGSSDSLDRQNN